MCRLFMDNDTVKSMPLIYVWWCLDIVQTSYPGVNKLTLLPGPGCKFFLSRLCVVPRFIPAPGGSELPPKPYHAVHTPYRPVRLSPPLTPRIAENSSETPIPHQAHPLHSYPTAKGNPAC